MSTFKDKRSTYVLFIVLLLFFLIDEFTLILYNISLFQYMCSNTLNLFLTEEIPVIYTQNRLELIYNYANDVFTSSDILFTNVYFPLCDDEFEAVFLENHSFISDDHEHIEQRDITFYKIKLEATNVKKQLIQFYPLQNYIYTIPGESSLIFYRLENNNPFKIQTLSVYVTSPSEAVAYIKKLQCFCYEELMVAPHSVIDLPILFSIDEEILNENFKEITINYILLLK